MSVYVIGEKVEVCGGSKKWMLGTVTKQIDGNHIMVRLDKPVLASFWEGRPRRIDANVSEITISIFGTYDKNIRRPSV